MNNHQEESAHSLEERCLNCEAPLLGQYCHHCGQKRGTTKLTLGQWFMLFWDNLVSIDGKLLKTIVPLLFMPGRVSRDYIEGRRARYVDPMRLFLVSSFLLFLLVDVPDKISFPNEEAVAELEEKVNKTAQENNQKADTLSVEQLFIEELAQKKSLSETIKTGSIVLQQFFEWLPNLLIFFMPLYAVFLKLFYLRNKDFYFTDHLVVSAYLHAVICFMYFLLFLCLRVSNSSWIGVGFWLLPAVYHFLTLKTVYRQGWIRTFFKFIFSTTLYFGSLFIATTLFIVFLWWQASSA